MSDNKSSRNKTYPLDILKRLLDSPQLLPHENSKEFLQLFDSLKEYGKPQSCRDYLAVYQSTVLTWDVLRYQDMKCQSAFKFWTPIPRLRGSILQAE